MIWQVKDARELMIFRRLSAVAAIVYSLWWLAVHLLMPQYYNPWPSRLAVVAFFLGLLLLSYFNRAVRENIRFLLSVDIWILTAHFYYLFYRNGGDSNWIIGAFITVMAVSYCFLSEISLLIYSGYVFTYFGGNHVIPARFPAMIQAQLHLLVLQLARTVKGPPISGLGTDPFRNPLEQHFLSEHGVEFYAHKLRLSPKALSMRTLRANGKSPRVLIHERLALEAKRLLAQSSDPVAEIAYALGFPDPNYFAHFFRIQTKLSPGVFRRHAR